MAVVKARNSRKFGAISILVLDNLSPDFHTTKHEWIARRSKTLEAFGAQLNVPFQTLELAMTSIGSERNGIMSVTRQFGQPAMSKHVGVDRETYASRPPQP